MLFMHKQWCSVWHLDATTKSAVREEGGGGGQMKDGYIIREDMIEYRMTEDMTENQRVWHMMTKAGPLIHMDAFYRWE